MIRMEQQDLFVSGKGGYFRYRIPTLLATDKGSVLAIAEARKYTGKDSDQIDLMIRRSIDGGKTFDAPRVIATQQDWVCGNPSPVQDRRSGRIWLLFNKNRQDGDERMICEGKAPRTVWKMYSDDDGLAWSEPEEITEQVKPKEWSWYATGPCHGLQLASGRLIIPCDHIVFKDYQHLDPYHSHIIYSDDGGTSWSIGGSTIEGTNECTAFESLDGKLCLNSRNKLPLPDGGNFRIVSWSSDGGESFSPGVHDAALPEPICQASIIRYAGAPESRILFSNPAARSGIAWGRHRMTVRMSCDEGCTWPVSRVIHAGPSAYSDLCVADDGTILCFFEGGKKDPYEKMILARFSLGWLLEGSTEWEG
jgi:sialidase-1